MRLRRLTFVSTLKKEEPISNSKIIKLFNPLADSKACYLMSTYLLFHRISQDATLTQIFEKCLKRHSTHGSYALNQPNNEYCSHSCEIKQNRKVILKQSPRTTLSRISIMFSQRSIAPIFVNNCDSEADEGIREEARKEDDTLRSTSVSILQNSFCLWLHAKAK